MLFIRTLVTSFSECRSMANCRIFFFLINIKRCGFGKPFIIVHLFCYNRKRFITYLMECWQVEVLKLKLYTQMKNNEKHKYFQASEGNLQPWPELYKYCIVVISSHHEMPRKPKPLSHESLEGEVKKKKKDYCFNSELFKCCNSD